LIADHPRGSFVYEVFSEEVIHKREHCHGKESAKGGEKEKGSKAATAQTHPCAKEELYARRSSSGNKPAGRLSIQSCHRPMGRLQLKSSPPGERRHGMKRHVGSLRAAPSLLLR
jgi:hypothetical protein